MEVDIASIAVFSALHLVLPAVVLVRAFRFPRGNQLATWAAAYCLELTPGNRSTVVVYLRRTRRFRAIGAAAGWTISGLPLFLGEPPPLGLSDLTLLMGGYFGGAALAELTLTRQRLGPGPRRAALVRREVDDYVAPWVRRLSWAAVALGVALLALYASLDLGEATGQPTVVELLPGVAGAALVVVVAELVQRRIVDRSQPLSAPDAIAADDALRAASVSTAAGAGIITALLALSSVLSSLGKAIDVAPVKWPLYLVALAALMLTVASFVSVFGPEPWWFGRRHDERAAA